MNVHSEIVALNPLLKAARESGHRIGLVPTMGALHRGHLSLVEKAATKNEVTVVSIFVNPTQFDNPEDLEKYPTDVQKDLELLSDYSKMTRLFVYTPEVGDLYPDGAVPETFDFGGLEHTMEGRFRPGHFSGMATVVRRLLKAVGPDRAYFGEKDFQQLQIVKKLVEIARLPVTIVPCPIVREPSGLAMSSRNERLSPEERKEAGLIYKVLSQVRKDFQTKNIDEWKRWVGGQFEKSELFWLEYFEIADEATLQPAPPLNLPKKGAVRAFIAAYAGEVRLIDNMALNL